MATQPQTHNKFSKLTGGRLDWYPVAASEDIRKGDILTITSSKVAQAISLPGSNSTGTASGGNLPIAAFAEENFTADSSGVSTDGQGRTRILVRVVDDTLRWETRGANFNSTTINSTNLTGSQCEQQDFVVDTAYQFLRWRGASAAEWWYEIYQDATSNGEFKCVNRSPNSAPGDDYGINIFKPALSATIRELA